MRVQQNTCFLKWPLFNYTPSSTLKSFWPNLRAGFCCMGSVHLKNKKKTQQLSLTLIPNTLIKCRILSTTHHS